MSSRTHYKKVNLEVNFPENKLNPNLGIGVRSYHLEELTESCPKSINWLEVLAEDYLETDGYPKKNLYSLRQYYPVSIHCNALSIGSVEDFNMTYLRKLKKLIDFIKPFSISDHLGWCSYSGFYFHDYFPVSFSSESLSYMSNRMIYVQDFLSTNIIWENIVSQFSYKDSSVPEWDFVKMLLKKTTSLLLLDLDSVYLNALNFGFRPQEYIDALDTDQVAQIHLSSNIRTPDSKQLVRPQVWDLLRYTLKSKKNPQLPILLEWNNSSIGYEQVENELVQVQKIWQEAFHV